MSLMVCDLSNFTLGAQLYIFKEGQTERGMVKDPTELAKFISTQSDIDQLILLGSDDYTLFVKNHIYSLLETQ